MENIALHNIIFISFKKNSMLSIKIDKNNFFFKCHYQSVDWYATSYLIIKEETCGEFITCLKINQATI